MFCPSEPPVTINSTLTQFGLLHEDLRESPADSPEEGSHQYHDEALQVELGGLECKHEEAAGDQEHNQDQQWVLVGQTGING